MEENVYFCENCGAQMINGVCPNCGAQLQQYAQPQYAQPQQNYSQPQQGPTFVSEDEVALATIGNSMGQNFFAGGGLLSTSAIVTNRRIYFKGTTFGVNGSISKSKVSKVIRLEEVTGTCVRTKTPIGVLIVGAIIFLVFLVAAIAAKSALYILPGFIYAGISVAAFFINKKKLLMIEYAGGGLAFDIKLIPSESCEAFMRAVHYAKDSMNLR